MKDKAIALLAAGASYTRVSQQLGCSTKSCYRWSKDPAVVEAKKSIEKVHTQAVQAAVETRVMSQAEAITDALGIISQAIPEGAREMRAIINNPKASAADKIKAFTALADRGGLAPKTVTQLDAVEGTAWRPDPDSVEAISQKLLKELGEGDEQDTAEALPTVDEVH